MIKYYNDKLTFSYTLWIVVFILCGLYLTEFSTDSNTLQIIFILVGLPALAFYWLIDLIVKLCKRHWLKAVSLISAPFLAVGFIVVLCKAGVTAHWVRFKIEESYYNEQIAKIPIAADKPRYKEFSWGASGTAISSCDYTLIYDESDKTSHLPEHKGISTTKMDEHFYVRGVCHPDAEQE